MVYTDHSRLPDSGSGEPTCHQFALARGLGRQNLGHVHDPLLLLKSRVQLQEVHRCRRLNVLNADEDSGVSAEEPSRTQ